MGMIPRSSSGSPLVKRINDVSEKLGILEERLNECQMHGSSASGADAAAQHAGAVAKLREEIRQQLLAELDDIRGDLQGNFGDFRRDSSKGIAKTAHAQAELANRLLQIERKIQNQDRKLQNQVGEEKSTRWQRTQSSLNTPTPGERMER